MQNINNAVFIGSVAMRNWFKDFNREPKDIDILYYDNESFLKREPLVGFDKRVERHYIDIYEWNRELRLCNRYIYPELLLTLKMSHIFWDINWDKHMFDIQFMLSRGIVYDKNLFYKLYEYWNIFHGKNKRSNLKMSGADFFNNAVKCKYDHDWLHTLINEKPTYNKVLKDNEEVDVDESKFNLLTHDEKLALVREEVYVMAYERYTDINYRHAYGRMLKKFLMNHAPIWEALFIIENYIELLKPEYNFINLINEKIQDGRTINYKIQ